MTKLYIQLDYEKTEILENGYCEKCLAPARQWIEPDRFGNFDVFPAEDHAGNMYGFLCPDCAKSKIERVDSAYGETTNMPFPFFFARSFREIKFKE